MRTYEKTHPWLGFTLDLRKASPNLWLLLGEAQSKVQHVAGVPLLPQVQEHFLQIHLAKGVLATTAIEGNTLTEEQVLQYLDGKLELPPSKTYLKQEIANIVEACNEIGHVVLSGRAGALSVEDIQHYNRLVLKDLPLEPEVVPGAVRSHEVGVARYKGAPAEDVTYLLERLCRWLNESFEPLPNHAIVIGILKAILAHLYIAWIHPFGDGNGRSARLIELRLLLAVGVPNISAHLLSNHYNQTRVEYYRQLDRSHRSGGDVLPFIEYALQGLVDGLQKQIADIRIQQLVVHWQNYVYDLFRDQDSPADRRRRRLALDLFDAGGVANLSRLRHISPRIAEAYAGKTEKTLKRDLARLVELELVEKTPQGGIRARLETILAFLPVVANKQS